MAICFWMHLERQQGQQTWPKRAERKRQEEWKQIRRRRRREERRIISGRGKEEDKGFVWEGDNEKKRPEKMMDDENRRLKK